MPRKKRQFSEDNFDKTSVKKSRQQDTASFSYFDALLDALDILRIEKIIKAIDNIVRLNEGHF